MEADGVLVLVGVRCFRFPAALAGRRRGRFCSPCVTTTFVVSVDETERGRLGWPEPVPGEQPRGGEGLSQLTCGALPSV